MEDKFWFLFVAYSIIWLSVLGYVWILVRREKSLRHDIDVLKDRLTQL
jgi:CcmD family protein